MRRQNSAPDSESAKQLPHPKTTPPVPKGTGGGSGKSPIPAPKTTSDETRPGSGAGGKSSPPPKQRDELDDVLDAELEKAMGGGKRRPRGGRGSKGGAK